MLSVSVLGVVELRRDGVLIPVRAGKTTEVLVRLALDAGTMVRSDRLIEDLWGADAVLTQRNTLQTKISRMRKELGDASLVVGDRAGYTLRVDPDAVDALYVARVAIAVRGALDDGDAARAYTLATEALAHFRGEILGDAGDADWVTPHRSQLEEVRLQLVEDRLAAALDCRAGGELIAELEAHVALHPLRERLWELLITALYRNGRQADALAAYTRVRDVLGEELGLEPGPALRALERRVLEHDPALAPPVVAAGNLPTLTAPLTGRDVDLAQLLALTNTERLVTIVGASGVGKTRLAIEAARGAGATSGAWLVRLETATSVDGVVEAIAAALRIAEGSRERVLDRLRASECFLVLDNCEHVIDAVAALVPELLDAAPALRVLATSQMPLGLDGEAVFALDPLPIVAAVELFVQHATRHRRGFALDDNNAALARELCTALDGLPLAIELAAARTKTLSLAEIVRRLDDRFALLQDATARRPTRRRALAAAIEWSYALLFPDDQRGLWALSSFAGTPSIAAVEHVLTALDVPPAAAIDVIARLVDRSLASVEEDDTGELRYRVLESVRAFGRARLHEAGCADAAAAAHAHWYADIADAVRAGTRGPAQSIHLACARHERADIDAALAWAEAHDPELALRIVNGFGWAWVVAGEGATAARRVRRALEAVGDAAPVCERVVAWSHLAWLGAGNALPEAEAAAAEAIRHAVTQRDAADVATAQLAAGFVAIQAARPDDARTHLAEARATFAELGDAWGEGSCCVLTVHAALFSGDVAAAGAALRDAERIVRPLGDGWGLGHLDAILGRVASAEGRHDDAARHLQDAADAAARLGHTTSAGYHLVNLGCALHEAGDADAARVALERAVEIGTHTVELRLASLARTHLGRVLLAAGDAAAAHEILTVADDWFRSAGGGDGADLAASLLATNPLV